MPNVTCACCGASTKEQKAIPNVVFRDEDGPFLTTPVLTDTGWPLRDERTLLVADAETRGVRPLEIPGKDAVRASMISAEEFAQRLERLKDGPEAGGDRVKYAEGTGTVSMGKLREALGALQHPGAQIIAKGMAATKFGGPLPPVGKCSFCGGAHLSEDHTAIGYLGRNEPAPDRIEAQALSYELPKDPVGAAPEYEQGTVAVRRSAKNAPSVGLEYYDAACGVWRPIVHPSLSEQFERAAFSLWSGH
jgi:hypothetical protein